MANGMFAHPKIDGAEFGQDITISEIERIAKAAKIITPMRDIESIAKSWKAHGIDLRWLSPCLEFIGRIQTTIIAINGIPVVGASGHDVDFTAGEKELVRELSWPR